MNNKNDIKNLIINADDLGISAEVNKAIFDLISKNKIDTASLLVNGTFVKEAIEKWNLGSRFPLYLHLCLTEGKPTSNKNKVSNLLNKNGILTLSFLQLFFYSFFYSKNNSFCKQLRNELKEEILSQIKLFKKLTNLDEIYLDGHQHIHLIPIILEIIIEISKEYKIRWIRTINEPLHTDLKSSQYKIIFSSQRWLKWIILRVLTNIAKPKILKSNIKTNHFFFGLLFTGRMTKPNIIQALKTFKSIEKQNYDKSMLIIHPGDFVINKKKKIYRNFPKSSDFISSIWRRREWESINDINL